MKDRHIAIGALMACCFFYPVTKAQITGEAEQSLSSADAARRNREQKRDVIRRSKRITDDDLKVQFVSAEEGGVRLAGVANAGGTPASVGELPIAQAIRGQASPDNGDTVAISGGIYMGSPPTSQTAPPNPAVVAAIVAADWAAIAATEPPIRKPGETEEEFEIATAKAQIAAAELQLNLQRREFALDQDVIYSNPNYLAWQTGKSKLDAEQQRIDERQYEIGEQKARLAVLEETQRQKQEISTHAMPPLP
jgi:hypothetical protein